jgi:hypothetical protein
MPRTSFMVGPKGKRVVVEEWTVTFPDPETGERIEFDLRCARGTFFNELPRLLVSLGYDPDDFQVEGQGKTWHREHICDHN